MSKEPLKNILSLSLMRKIKNFFSSNTIERKIFLLTDSEIELFLFERVHNTFSADEAYRLLYRYGTENPCTMNFSTTDVILAELVMILNYYENGIQFAPLRNQMQIQRIQLLDSILYTCKKDLMSIFKKQKRYDNTIAKNLFLKKDYHLSQTQFQIIINKVDALLPCKNHLNSMKIYRGPKKIEDLTLEELCVISIFSWNEMIKELI